MLSPSPNSLRLFLPNYLPNRLILERVEVVVALGEVAVRTSRRPEGAVRRAGRLATAGDRLRRGEIVVLETYILQAAGWHEDDRIVPCIRKDGRGAGRLAGVGTQQRTRWKR